MVLGREFNVYGENTGNTIMIEKTQVMDSEPARYNPHTGEMESLHPEDTRAESGETRAR